jgi:hypothetical protein
MARLEGTKNKVQQATRETFKLLLEEQMPQIRSDLAKLEPYQRIRVILDLAKFVVPQLRSIEVIDEKERKFEPINIVFQNEEN